jgi:hypothetical protein
MRVANGIPLGCPPSYAVRDVNSVQPLKADHHLIGRIIFNWAAAAALNHELCHCNDHVATLKADHLIGHTQVPGRRATETPLEVELTGTFHVAFVCGGVFVLFVVVGGLHFPSALAPPPDLPSLCSQIHLNCHNPIVNG